MFQRADRNVRILEKRANRLLNHVRLNQRLVALHVDHDVGVERPRDFREPIRAGLMRPRSHPRLPAELPHRRLNARIVRRHDDFGKKRDLRRLLIHALNQGLSGYVHQRLAGKAHGIVSRWNNADDLHANDSC